ncbi:MCE family protein [Mycolicibacterium thermoresistibile]|uniref:Virulence factor Mce family protein n=2 Tax=Mycolicibacterium thermoresistibile TaxID=1797 RepID=G7CHA8_MYCT3|nr:MlaD family protein [Mycolicibacterium thermoresistibile]EHI12218.1 virulence factor Mce family protein [Mycolicibacterium thermoresistibile ATCC 19527]MCV7191070.1 MCE family protein [Mycolicibacterium thermoresistibile]GAT15584.1 virulence factor Mce family protein [Mycolicibacterium thermoresistibile]SNW16865.1 virulence factor Mce family protein [Mycolicibacterium thermoresistibile]
MQITRIVRIQLAIFGALTVVAVVALLWYYLRVPALLGVGQYTLYAELPSSGGLYATANVTYHGVTIGKVTEVLPTERGARATMSISERYRIPVDVTANVHSVSAIGEQYLDLVATDGGGQYLSDGDTITEATVPAEIGPALDTVDRALAALPRDRIASLLDETSSAVAGLGPTLYRLVDATQSVVADFRAYRPAVGDVITHAGPIIDSQVESGADIAAWSAQLDELAAQAAEHDAALQRSLRDAAPTARAVHGVLEEVRDGLPQTLANLTIVLDMLKRYHDGVEQVLVILPQGAAVAQTVAAPFPGQALLHFNLAVNQPPPCFSGFVPASQWRSPADTTRAPLPDRLSYCKIPKDADNVVRGARNYPCADVPGKRAATPQECRSDEPYVPAGTNPWYGEPGQIRTCPAPGARCDQPVEPGRVIPAPTVNTGEHPLPADRLPPPPLPRSDPLTPPGQGTVRCDGRQPNPCVYTPAHATFHPARGEVIGPDGVRYRLEDSSGDTGDAWKSMLAPR